MMVRVNSRSAMVTNQDNGMTPSHPKTFIAENLVLKIFLSQIQKTNEQFILMYRKIALIGFLIHLI